MSVETRSSTMYRLLAWVGGLTGLSTLGAGMLWILGYQLPAVALLSLTIALWLLFIIMGTVLVTAWWTRQTMRAGAELALRAQDINDRWDANKMGSLARLMSEGARIGRANSPTLSAGTIPGPTLSVEEGEWLPQLTEFNGAAVFNSTESE